MNKNLEKLVEWLNENKEYVFDGKYERFSGIFSDIVARWVGSSHIVNGPAGTVFHLKDILLDHSVAKKRWGKKTIEIYPFGSEGDYKYWEEHKAWHYHLRQMVLMDEEEMLKYFVEVL